jgi:hypothetical protein
MSPKLSWISQAWLVLAAALPGASWGADLEIRHVTIVSPERSDPLHDALVRVHDGRIVSISKTVVRASGRRAPLRWMAPGSSSFPA